MADKIDPAKLATQNFVSISEITKDTVVLKDGSMRQVIKVTPIPLDLRTEKEQESAVYQFRSFLNSLKFPIEVVIQNRRVDLKNYLDKIKLAFQKEENDLLKIQMQDYIDFLSRLVNEINLMDRSYYVIVSHSKEPAAAASQKTNFFDKIFGSKKLQETVYTTQEFAKLLEIIKNKAYSVVSYLDSMGISSSVLKTEELIELYYNTYNPEEASTEQVTEMENITQPVIKRSQEDHHEQVFNQKKWEQVAPLAAPPQGSAPQVAVPAIQNQTVQPANVTSSAQAMPQIQVPQQQLIKPAPPKMQKKTLSEILSLTNKTTIDPGEEVYKKGLADVIDIISPAGLSINPQYIQLGNFFVRTLFVLTYPRYLTTGWLSPIYNLDSTVDISMFIYPLENDVLLGQLRKKTTQLQSSLQVQTEKGLVRDPELETAIGDIEELRDTLQKGETRLFQFSLYFTLYASSLDELKKVTKQAETMLGGILVYTKWALLQMEEGFNTTLPIGTDSLDIKRNLDTDSLSTVFPFSSQDLSHHDGVLYGINLHNSSIVLYDRFRMENANQVVFAKSGAGKSYTVKLEALRLLMMGTEIIIIDPENEYKLLCEAIGGTYVEISLNSKQRINPFDLPKYVEGTDDSAEDLLRSNIASLHGLISLMAGGLSPTEDSILDKALYETYQMKDISFDPATQNNEPPLLKDLVDVLANMQGGGELINRLLKFSEGSFSNLFNSATNIDLKNRFTVFSVRNVEDDLRPIAMYLVLTHIWSKVKSQLKKRILLIDEAWWMMRFEDTAKFLNALAKRARKYYLGVTIISQDVEDFMNSDYGRAVVTNSATQVLLGQSQTALDKLADIFKLTDGEQRFLQTCKVGQGILIAGSDRAAIQIIASYTEDQLITTNPEQLMTMFGSR